MKMPVGVLGMTETELADLYQTNKWPERTIDVSDPPPGFGPNGLNDGRATLARQEGRREAREMMRADAILELKNEQSSRGPGRPTSRNGEIEKMLAIIAANPGKGEKHCRASFEELLREHERDSPRIGESDGKDWLGRRSRRAWVGAQEALSKA
jgi:hypothetical protein